MKVLVVGMNPSNKPTLGMKQNSTFRKLEKWMTECGVHHFSFCNTFDDPSEPKLSKVDFQRLCEVTKDYDKIVALGGFVSKPLNRIGASHFTLPHPSPLNRLLNDKAYETEVVNKCKDYLNDTRRSSKVL